MSVCLVLGAGATLANAEHFRGERRTGENPPLDYTFFDRVRTLQIVVPSELRDYAAGIRLPDPFDVRTTGVRAEEFFRDLFADFQEAMPGDPVVTAYEQLIALYVRVLRDTTNWLGADNRTGAPVGQLIASAASRTSDLRILTFNHDLVIENEVHKRRRLTTRWCIDEGYGSFSLALRVAGSAVDSFRRHGSDCERNRAIQILKLHGSLNWYVRMNGRHPSPRFLSGAVQNPTIFTTVRRAIPTRLRSTKKQASGRGRTTWYTWPVVIPPVYGKEPLIRTLVPKVWSDAADALAGADRIVFFGYSLPELDVRAQRLFQRGMSDNHRLRWIDVVNPDPISCGRYAAVLRPSGLRWYPSVESFIENNGLD